MSNVYDFIKNEKVFNDADTFSNRMSSLATGKIKSIKGSVAYDYAPDYEIPFEIVVGYYEGVKHIGLRLSFKGCSYTLYYKPFNLFLDYEDFFDWVDFFFRKCGDDDSFWEVRRAMCGLLFKAASDSSDCADECQYLNILFNTNL